MSKVTMGGKSAFKIQRRLGIELPGLGKAGALERRPYGPGVHGMKRKAFRLHHPSYGKAKA